jgi:hypothetical protein
MRFSTFFQKSKAVFEKWTFIFVQFSKSQNTFEKTLHHSFSKLLLSISPKNIPGSLSRFGKYNIYYFEQYMLLLFIIIMQYSMGGLDTMV